MKIVTKTDKSGKTIYSSEILSPIVKCAAEEIEGVVKYEPKDSKVSKRYADAVKIETIGDYIYINIYIKVYHYVKVKEVSYRIQEAVKNTIESMTEFVIKDINVHVIDVEFKNFHLAQQTEEDAT